MRNALETAQAKLSKFQQEKGIVVSDERFDQENARYVSLATQLAAAQAELVDAGTRQRNTGAETSPDVMGNGGIQGLKAQLASLQTKLTELSEIVGKNHPSRVSLEAQIGELRQQIAAETRRVAGTASTVSRTSSEKVTELQALLEAQKKLLLGLRSDRDQVSVLVRDVDTAQHAYDAISARNGQFVLEAQNNQANTRLLSPAVEPLEPSKPRVAVGILGSIVGGLAAGMIVALAWELLDRRVRDPEDLFVVAGVPVLGVLRPEGSKRPVFRRLLNMGPAGPPRPLLAAPGVSA